MKLFKNKPLCTACALFFAMSALAFYIDKTAKIMVAFIITVTVIIILIIALTGKIKRWNAGLCGVYAVFMLCALFLSYLYFDAGYLACEKYYGKECHVVAVVRERRSENAYNSVLGLQITEIDGKKTNFNAILECDYISDAQIGYVVSGKLTGEALTSFQGSYAVKSLIADGYYMLFCDNTSEADVSNNNEEEANEPSGNLEIIGIKSNTIIDFARKTNKYLSVKLRSSVRGNSGELASALLLGNKTSVSDEIARDFRRAGVSHILALSGMHMTIILGFADFLIKKIGFGKKLRCVLLILTAFSYLFLTGCSLSAARSVIMLTVVYSAYVFGGNSDTLTNLFVAAVLILLFSPQAICDIGFLLSVLATFSIVVGGEYISSITFAVKKISEKYKLLKIPLFLLTSLAITLCANVGIALIMWAYFGEVSLMGPLATLIITPLAFVLMILSIVYFPFSVIAPIGSFIAALINKTGSIILAVVTGLSKNDSAVISLKNKFSGIIIIIMSIVLLVMLMLNIKKKLLLLLPPLTAAVVLCIGIILNSCGTGLNIVYYHKTQSEMIVLCSPQGTVVCDMSDGSYSHFSFASDAVKNSGNTTTNILLLTHYHRKHATSVSRYIKNNIVKEIRLPLPETEKEFSVMMDIYYRAQEQNVPVSVYKNGEAVNLFGDTILSVNKEYIERSTHPIISLSLQTPDDDLCYIGSSYDAGENKPYADCATIDAEYVIFGSHGPIIKKRYSYPIDSRYLKTVIFASDEIARYADTDDLLFRINLDDTVLVSSADIYYFELK